MAHPNRFANRIVCPFFGVPETRSTTTRSEEHTSELQSRSDLVCRLLLEKKKKTRHSRPRSPPPTTLPLGALASGRTFPVHRGSVHSHPSPMSYYSCCTQPTGGSAGRDL